MKLAPNEALANLSGPRPGDRPAAGSAAGAESFDPLLSAMLGGDPAEAGVARSRLPTAALPPEEAPASEMPPEDEAADEALAARALLAAYFQGSAPADPGSTGERVAGERPGAGSHPTQRPDGAESGAERMPPPLPPLGPGSPIGISRALDPEVASSPNPLQEVASALRPGEAFGEAPAGGRLPASEADAGLRLPPDAQPEGSLQKHARVDPPDPRTSPADRAMAGERAALAATPPAPSDRGFPPEDATPPDTPEARRTEAASSRPERAAARPGNEPRPSEVGAPGWRGAGAPPAAAPQPLAETVPDPSLPPQGSGPSLDAVQSPAGLSRDPRAVVATTRPAELPGRIAWLADQGGGNATIRLDPPQLGEIDVSVRVRGQHVEIVIQTEHAEARQLMGDSRERLTEALALKELRLDTLELRASESSRGASERGGEQGLAAREEPGDRSLLRDDARQRHRPLGGGEPSLALASRQNLQRASNTGVDLRV